jgi:hypothetical protein
LNTNESGAFAIEFKAPSLAYGGHTVGAVVGGQTLDTCFTILRPDYGMFSGDDYTTPVQVALSSISHQLIRVWGYHNGMWMMYDPQDLPGCTLEGLVNGRAYWIKVSDDCRLIFRDLTAGWNNIGW